MTDQEATSLGIPYAWGEVVNGHLEVKCPVCGLRIVEGTDATGEQTTTNYAKHYAKKHEEKKP